MDPVNELNVMRLLIFISVLSLTFTGTCQDVEGYKLDLKRAEDLMDSPAKMPLPNRVAIYSSGLMPDFDKRFASAWISDKPGYITTNSSEITKLIDLIRPRPFIGIVSNATLRLGITYHVLWFSDGDKTYIHYRIVDYPEAHTNLCAIIPRDLSGTGWFSKDIQTWLHERIQLGSNESQKKQK